MHAPAIITTIIPTYRRPQLLKKAINSVLNQTYPYVRVCVYDNASNDETVDVVNDIARKDSRVFYHCHHENIGAANNFNFGFNNVRTAYFSFLSDDDELLIDFYKTAIDQISSHPNVSFCALRTIVRSDDKISCRKFNPGYYEPPRGIKMLARRFPPPTWTSIVYNTSIMRAVGGLDLSLGYTVDHEFTLRAAIEYPFVISSEHGSVFNYSVSSASKIASIESLSSDRLRLISKLKAIQIRKKLACRVSFYATAFYLKNMLIQSTVCFLNRDFNSGIKILKASGRMLM